MPADTATAALDDVAPEAGVSKPDPILVVDGVRKSFGGLVAVDVEHFEVPRGVITALIGPNGAGKTTFFNVVSGFDDPDRGQWTFDGEDVSRRPAHVVAKKGMVRTFQLTKSLMKMSVIDNMLLAAPDQLGERFLPSLLPWTWRSQEMTVEQHAEELLDRFGITRMRDEYAGTLSGGQRKLLEMARALMVRPRLIMLDEPMAGVNPALTQSLLHHVTALPDDGTTVLFVEHDMDVVMDISDWVVCMAEGRIIAEGRPQEITQNRAVIDAYLGEQHDEPQAAPPGEPDDEGGSPHA